MFHKQFIIIISFILLTLFACNHNADLEVQAEICEKEISLFDIENSDNGNTIFILQHIGFCYNYIDSFVISEKYYSKNNNLLIHDSIIIGNRQFDFIEKNDNNCKLSVSSKNLIDTAYNIDSEITAKYQNSTKSNTVSLWYEPVCTKEISCPSSEFVAFNDCEINFVYGDSYIMFFTHSGYCSEEIVSIDGNGDFYSDDGYFWSSSKFSIPIERITVENSDWHSQPVSNSVCITWNYADYVRITFWTVYSDSTTSNEITFDIERVYNKKSKNSVSILSQIH